jgi:hypothetical protein
MEGKRLFWKIITGIFLSILLGCQGELIIAPNVVNISSDDTLEEKKEILKDERLAFYEQEIKEYYQQQYTESDIPIELGLSGTIGYEDEQILILHFDEILEFGSWHYTNSALFFMKQGERLVRVKTPTIKDKLLADFYQRKMQYPNRIEGRLHQHFDLTGDGIKEYIFYATGMVRTNVEDAYHIYQLDTRTQELKLMNLYTKGSFVEGECESAYGMQEELKVIEQDSFVLPIIKLKRLQTICIDSVSQVDTINVDYEYYQWKGQEFLRIER